MAIQCEHSSAHLAGAGPVRGEAQPRALTQHSQARRLIARTYQHKAPLRSVAACQWELFAYTVGIVRGAAKVAHVPRISPDAVAVIGR
jgi:hypothetical protein